MATFRATLHVSDDWIGDRVGEGQVDDGKAHQTPSTSERVYEVKDWIREHVSPFEGLIHRHYHHYRLSTPGTCWGGFREHCPTHHRAVGLH